MRNLALSLFIVLSLFGSFSLLSCAEKMPIKLKIMSYNIRHGEGLDTIVDLSRAANIINSIAPDLCGIQEVDHFCTRSGKVGQTDYLAQATSMNGTFGKFMDYQGGEYGMASLTAKPLLSTKILKLPDGKYEARSSIVHEVQLGDDCVIAFANVHFDWIGDEEGSNNRLNQAKALVKYLDSLNRPAIITGDFNCTPDSPTMQYLAKQGFVFVEKDQDNLSFQGKVKGEIDHLIFRNLGEVKFTKKSIRLLDEPLVSDHRPLVAELEVTF